MLILYYVFADKSSELIRVFLVFAIFVEGEQIMYEIFEQLLQKYGVTPYKVSKATGISQSSLSDWKMGKITPKTSTLQKIADYFGVSLDYLTTGKVASEEKKNPFSDLKGIYLSYAKEAQDSGIDPDDIKLALETIKRLRGEK